jgi:hypothetical protein
MLYREIMAVCSQIHTKHTNTAWNEMIWNDIYLLQFGFRPVAVVGSLVLYENRKKTAQMEKQCTKQYKNTEHTK